MRQSVEFAHGAGCQSNAIMALIKFDKAWIFSKLGEIPETAWTVDTNAENNDSYESIAFWWKHAPIDYRVVSHSKSLIWEESNAITLPYFTRGEDGKGQLQKRCCTEYKVKVLRNALRQHLKYKRSEKIPENRVKLWVGLSADEFRRVNKVEETWIQNRYPLVELGWTRYDCIQYLKSHNLGFLAEHSSCFCCPFMKKPDWERLDKLLFNAANLLEFSKRKNGTLKNELFLHASRKALGSKFYFDEEIDVQPQHDF